MVATSNIMKFQSTHPRGVRLACRKALTFSRLFQSTHPRGVRQKDRLFIRHVVSFNPRTREGCDVAPSAPDPAETGFNPRTREVRRIHCNTAFVILSFNPRTREGATRVCGSGCQWPSRFNPRTREGCDSQIPVECSCRPVSIHAPARGATPLTWLRSFACRFQSTHPRGVRQQLFAGPRRIHQFQSTHPRGVRR